MHAGLGDSTRLTHPSPCRHASRRFALLGLACLAAATFCGCFGSAPPPPSAVEATQANATVDDAPAAASTASVATTPETTPTPEPSSTPEPTPAPPSIQRLVGGETFPPVAWAVPPGGAPLGEPIVDVIDIGGELPVFLFDGRRDVYLAPAAPFTSPGLGHNHQLTFGKFDPQTGKATEPPFPLPAECVSNVNGPYFVEPIADVSSLGALAVLAVGKSGDAKAPVAVLAPGDVQAQLLPTLRADGWLRWTADERLAVLHAGRLELWSLDGEEPAVAVGAKLGLPAVVSPARNWIIATVDGKHLEVFDAQSGATLGRLGAIGKWRQLAVSPSGAKLVGVRYAGDELKAPFGVRARFDLHVWDLTTSREVSHIMNESTAPPVRWLDEGRFFHDGKVFDVASGATLATFNTPAFAGVTTPTGSPDGRLWWTAKCGQAFTTAPPAEPAGGKRVFDEQSPITLDVSGVEEAHHAEVEQAITAGLTEGGRTIGPSDWTLRITTKVEEGANLLLGGELIRKPQSVAGELQLVGPGDVVAAKIPFVGRFAKENTAYLVRTIKTEPPKPPVVTYEYDYQGQEPRAAILAESWRHALVWLRARSSLPTIWEVNGQVQPLPAPATAIYPAEVKP